MTQAALTLSLSVAQVEQLVGYCVAYRTHAWREIVPTAERNQTLRAVQAVQGRLTVWRIERGTEPLLCSFTEEEWQALRQMLVVLVQVAGARMASEERARALSGLTSWFQLLRLPARQTQAL